MRALVHDMGGSNVSMWRYLGIFSKRNQLKNWIRHPCARPCCHGSDVSCNDKCDTLRLYFIADPPHLLKSIRNCLLVQNIVLPADICNENDLPSNTVKMLHAKQLVRLQEDRALKVTPKLSKQTVEPSKFQKMKVKLAANLLSRDTACGLRLFSQLKELPQEVITTAYFFELVGQWFSVMNSRLAHSALSVGSEKVSELQKFICLMSNLKFTGRDEWKPIQAGTILSTQSILDLFDDLVVNGKLLFLMAGRFTQDPCENLFSCIRGLGDPTPTPVRFRYNLRNISCSQYMRIASSANCEEDDTVYFLSYLKKRPDLKLELSKSLEPQDEMACVTYILDTDFDLADRNVFYFLAGWCLFKESSCIATCHNCKLFFYGNADECPEDSILVKLKSFGALTLPCKRLVESVQHAEAIFLSLIDSLLTYENLEKCLIGKFRESFFCDDFPKCHNFLYSMISRFYRLRLHAYGKLVTSKENAPIQHGSKSAFSKSIKMSV